MFNPMKPHCLECPYKPPLEREKVVAIEEPQGDAKAIALKELFEPGPSWDCQRWGMHT